MTVSLDHPVIMAMVSMILEEEKTTVIEDFTDDISTKLHFVQSYRSPDSGGRTHSWTICHRQKDSTTEFYFQATFLINSLLSLNIIHRVYNHVHHNNSVMLPH